MPEEITLTFSDEEKEAIRARATELAGKEATNDEWGRTAELSATKKTVEHSTGASVTYLLTREIKDDTPDVDEWGNPVD